MNLLITGAWQAAKAHLPEIEALGHRVVFLQQEADALPCDPAWVEGAVCNGLFLHHLMAQFASLRFVQLTSAGFDRVDLDFARTRGIEIRNARGVYSVPMAEFAVCGVLQLYKQSRFFNEDQTARRWEKHRGLLELFGKTVTVLGCGSVGTECAKRFAAFGCRVLGVDLYPREDANYHQMLPLDGLDGLLPETDVLVLTVPLTPETEHLIDRRRLGLLPRGAVVVNISRGRVLEEAALAEALADGRLSGAALDVFEEEPLPASSPLWTLPNLIITPHNSFVGEHNTDRLSGLILQTLKEMQ